jgi:hypothetical protein
LPARMACLSAGAGTPSPSANGLCRRSSAPDRAWCHRVCSGPDGRRFVWWTAGSSSGLDAAWPAARLNLTACLYWFANAAVASVKTASMWRFASGGRRGRGTHTGRCQGADRGRRWQCRWLNTVCPGGDTFRGARRADGRSVGRGLFVKPDSRSEGRGRRAEKTTGYLMAA